MLLALLLASGSALLGGALALAVRRRRVLLELTRTFAFAAAAGVVGLHLLPEVLESLGAAGLLWALLGFALPGLLEWRARSLGPGLRARGFSPARVAAEIGLLALVAHSLLEGVALCAAASGSGPHLDLEIALVAHHAPLTAAVILPFLELLDARGVALRVLAVALAGGIGALAGGLVPGGFATGHAQEIASAVMAGALLHVVADEIRAQTFEAGWERAADLGAALVGAGIAIVSAIYGASLDSEFLAGLAALILPCAPALLAADLLAAIPPARRSLAPRPELDALLVSLRSLGILAALAQFAVSFLGWTLSSAFAPGEARPPEEGRGYLARLLLGTSERDPRRVVAALLCALAFWLPPRSADVATPGLMLLAAAVATLVVLLIAGLSASIAALLAAALLAAQTEWAPNAALLIPALALGPLLFRGSAWRGDLKRRSIGALLTLVLGACAAMLLSRPLFVDRAQAAAGALVRKHALPFVAQLQEAPLPTAAAAALVALGLLALWQTGARGFFAPLRTAASEGGGREEVR